MIRSSEHINKKVKVARISKASHRFFTALGYDLGDEGTLIACGTYPRVKRSDGSEFLAMWSDLEPVIEKQPMTLEAAILVADELGMPFTFICESGVSHVWYRFLVNHRISFSTSIVVIPPYRYGKHVLVRLHTQRR